MAHRVTAPAMQRAQRLLSQRIRPCVLSRETEMTIEAIDEAFDAPRFEDAVRAPRRLVEPGSAWGRPWHTTWFRLTHTVDERHAGRRMVASVDIGFNGRYDGFQAEAIAWIDGRIVHAIQPDRRTIDLGERAIGEVIEIWVEAAATPVIAGHASGYGPTSLGDPQTAPNVPLYVMRRADIAVFDAAVEELTLRLQAVIDLTLDSSENEPGRARLFDALERAGNAIDVNDVSGTAAAGIDALSSVFDGSGPRPRHRVVASGHAHLDTAWLWPIRETRRKAVRTFANAVHLLRLNPDVVFTHSQAQHYEWVSEDAPQLFDEVRRLVAEGRWEPVGGMWVETDLNLPSGESLLRQMIHGQRAFQSWFGRRCDGAFLPDDFGYPGSLPQIVRHAGGRWFFTQKLSWNETNRMPHHSFWWEGIDGSRLFAHFSPVDTYNAILMPSQLRFAERNFADHVGATMSLALFGHGDGGGGPTQQMIDRGRIAGSMDSVPSVTFGTVAGFFDDAIEEYGARAPVWVGEMYFEKHRGTYSSQIGTKQGNRNSERLLHEIELWSAATASKVDGLEGWWRRVLTQQFHDIIPGSSIAWVHRDAEAEHAEIARRIEEAIDEVLSPRFDDSVWLANPAPVDLDGVVDVDGVPERVIVPAMSIVELGRARRSPANPVRCGLGTDGTSLVVENGLVRVTFADDGGIVSLVHVGSGREFVRPGSRIGLTIRRDTPAEYDAWDIDMADADAPATSIGAESPPRIESVDERRVVVVCEFAHGSSRFRMRWSVVADSARVDVAMDADWHEVEKRVQLIAPIDVMAREAVCGTQFGHVRRARHGNTSWDVARFETCAHRYVVVGEPGASMAIVADGPRGYDNRGDALRLTLLRAPLFPDPTADRGGQRVEWSYFVADHDVIASGLLEREAALIGHPRRVVRGTPEIVSVGVRVDSEGVSISSVKSADDGSGDIVIRLWETRGGRATGRLTFDRPVTSVVECNALEEPSDAAPITVTASSIELTLRPFEIRTLRARR